MASDLREYMSSDGVPTGLTGFPLWGFVGILVRPSVSNQVRHQGQPLLVELEG